jgi:predicted nucleotidyltransferase
MKLFTVEERKVSLEKELQRVIRIIIDKYNPEKIILFGSLVEGKIHEWSDIDLLIIKKTDKRSIERCIELAGLVKPKIGIDFFIYTPDEFKTLIRERYSFISEIIKKGKVVYEKRD